MNTAARIYIVGHVEWARRYDGEWFFRPPIEGKRNRTWGWRKAGKAPPLALGLATATDRRALLPLDEEEGLQFRRQAAKIKRLEAELEMTKKTLAFYQAGGATS